MEIVELGRKIEAIERPEAAKRKTAGVNQHSEPAGKLPEASKGDTRDKVGEALGVSGKTYEKLKAVKANGVVSACPSPAVVPVPLRPSHPPSPSGA